MDDLNQIPYFSDVEDTFTRLREKHLFLSPTDWTLIESWKDRGIPVHVVLRSIENVFENHKSAARKRAINSLRYCQDEVEAQFDEYQKSQVGKNVSEPGAVATGSSDRDPFGKDAVIAHLEARRDELLKLTEAPDGLKIAILHVTEKLDALVTGARVVAGRIDVPNTELGLTTLEAILDTAIAIVAGDDRVAEARAAAEALFSEYKDRMPAKVYEQSIERELRKRLREMFNVPRLSLFHMK